MSRNLLILSSRSKPSSGVGTPSSASVAWREFCRHVKGDLLHMLRPLEYRKKVFCLYGWLIPIPPWLRHFSRSLPLMSLPWPASPSVALMHLASFLFFLVHAVAGQCACALCALMCVLIGIVPSTTQLRAHNQTAA
jgi:hypothetical protein